MKVISDIFVIISFLLTGTFEPVTSYADDFHLPPAGVMIRLSPPLNPPLLKGIKVNPANPFRLEFILDKGANSPSFFKEGVRGSSFLKQESTRLTMDIFR